jgi:hypothetical protein
MEESVHHFYCNECWEIRREKKAQDILRKKGGLE